MKLVFIRHGKTDSHEARRRQGPDSQLSPAGKKQVRLLAGRLKKSLQTTGKTYDSIITSPWLRAVQTAEIIARKTGLSVTPHPLIFEYRSNIILNNQPYDSQINQEYIREATAKGINFDWKFRGQGECLRDVINRVREFKRELITQHHGKNYLVVSHGLFITTFITLMILGDDCDDLSFYQVYNLIHLENTSLTRVAYLENENRWQLITLNDHHHLEEP